MSGNQLVRALEIARLRYAQALQSLQLAQQQHRIALDQLARIEAAGAQEALALCDRPVTAWWQYWQSRKWLAEQQVAEAQLALEAAKAAAVAAAVSARSLEKLAERRGAEARRAADLRVTKHADEHAARASFNAAQAP